MGLHSLIGIMVRKSTPQKKIKEVKEQFEYALEKAMVVEEYDIISDNITMDGNIEIRYNLEINNTIREKIKHAFNNISDYEIWTNYKNDNDKIIFKVDIKDH